MNVAKLVYIFVKVPLNRVIIGGPNVKGLVVRWKISMKRNDQLIDIQRYESPHAIFSRQWWCERPSTDCQLCVLVNVDYHIKQLNTTPTNHAARVVKRTKTNDERVATFWSWFKIIWRTILASLKFLASLVRGMLPDWWRSKCPKRQVVSHVNPSQIALGIPQRLQKILVLLSVECGL